MQKYVEKYDIYNRNGKAFKRETKNLNKSDISEDNKNLIRLFQDYCYSKNLSELRIVKISTEIRYICEWLKHELGIEKDLSHLEKNDLMKLVSYINRIENKKEATKADYRRTIKQFYKWYKEEDNRIYDKDDTIRIESTRFYHYIETGITGSYKRTQADPNTIISEDDIRKVIEFGCENVRDIAFISCLHEWGCRASEFLNIKIGNILFKESYMEVHVPDGKTGKRVIFAVKSMPTMLRYLEVHPFKKDKNSFIWLSEANFTLNKPIHHRGGQKLINRCFERAKVHKKHNFHWFRHSRATILAPKLTEAMLCKYMGWTLSSRQVKTYVHLCNAQLEDVLVRMHGIKTEATEEDKLEKCVCGTMNHPSERFCQRCYRPLHDHVLIHEKEIKDSEIFKKENSFLEKVNKFDKSTIQFMLKVAKNKDMMDMLEDMK